MAIVFRLSECGGGSPKIRHHRQRRQDRERLVKVLRYLVAFAIVATVFVAGGMAAATAQGASMQTAAAAQAAQTAALQAALAASVAGVQARPPGASDRCDVPSGGSCSVGQGITFTILPPGATPPPTTPPDDGGNNGGNNGGNGNDGGTNGAKTPTKLPRTGPSATGWAAILGIGLIEIGMVVLVRGNRWTRRELSQLA